MIRYKILDEDGSPIEFFATEDGKLRIELPVGEQMFFPAEAIEAIKEILFVIQRELKPVHSFCVTPGSKCKMGYCDDNGCQDRKRELAAPIIVDLRKANHD